MKITAEQAQERREQAYRAGARMDSDVRVFLDGAEQKQVLEADDAAGTVLRITGMEYGKLVKETAHGQVRIELPTWWGPA